MAEVHWMKDQNLIQKVISEINISLERVQSHNEFLVYHHFLVLMVGFPILQSLLVVGNIRLILLGIHQIKALFVVKVRQSNPLILAGQENLRIVVGMPQVNLLLMLRNPQVNHLSVVGNHPILMLVGAPRMMKT